MPVGTIRTWKDGFNYKKVAKGKWVRVSKIKNKNAGLYNGKRTQIYKGKLGISSENNDGGLDGPKPIDVGKPTKIGNDGKKIIIVPKKEIKDPFKPIDATEVKTIDDVGSDTVKRSPVTPTGTFSKRLSNLQTKKDGFFNNYFDLSDLKKIGVKNGGGGSYDRVSKTIAIGKEHKKDFDKALSKIYNKETLDEHDVKVFSIFVHEHEHHSQKFPYSSFDVNEPYYKIFETFTEMNSRRRTVEYLKKEYNGQENDYDFNKLIKNGYGYQSRVEKMSAFIEKIGGNIDEIVELFTIEARKETFNRLKADYILLDILNRDRTEENEIKIKEIRAILK